MFDLRVLCVGVVCVNSVVALHVCVFVVWLVCFRGYLLADVVIVCFTWSICYALVVLIYCDLAYGIVCIVWLGWFVTCVSVMIV